MTIPGRKYRNRSCVVYTRRSWVFFPHHFTPLCYDLYTTLTCMDNCLVWLLWFIYVFFILVLPWQCIRFIVLVYWSIIFRCHEIENKITPDKFLLLRRTNSHGWREWLVSCFLCTFLASFWNPTTRELPGISIRALRIARHPPVLCSYPWYCSSVSITWMELQYQP